MSDSDSEREKNRVIREGGWFSSPPLRCRPVTSLGGDIMLELLMPRRRPRELYILRDPRPRDGDVAEGCEVFTVSVVCSGPGVPKYPEKLLPTDWPTLAPVRGRRLRRGAGCSCWVSLC